MTTAITLRLPSNLLNQVLDQFDAKSETKTKAIIKALEKGLKYDEVFKEKLIADYQSIGEEDIQIAREAGAFAHETLSNEDFSAYDKYL